MVMTTATIHGPAACNDESFQMPATGSGASGAHVPTSPVSSFLMNLLQRWAVAAV